MQKLLHEELQITGCEKTVEFIGCLDSSAGKIPMDSPINVGSLKCAF